MSKKTVYQQTLDYLFQQLPMFHRIGPAAFKKDLTNTLVLCGHLGHPEREFPSIHIAGTNGKGSVAHIFSAILTASGLKTGLYTSPHYRDFRERIKIDGQFISQKDVVSFVEEHKGFCEGLKPSFFEWTVGLAFDYFAKQHVDVAVIETGLGGRLDSTNVLTPILSIITNIGYDHQQFLGETLPEIAGEKAGIIKPGVPVVIGETQPETEQVFRRKASECASPIFFADQHFTASLIEKKGQDSVYKVTNTSTGQVSKITLDHAADYQAKNLTTVLQACDLLGPIMGLPVAGFRKAIATGLSQVKSLSNFIGRWEIISERPAILIDSAHNEAGMRLALEGLNKMSYGRLYFVFGAVNDKSLDKLLALLPTDAVYFFAKANIPRGLDAEQLRSQAAGYGLRGKSYSSVRKALAAAKRKASVDDLVFVAGSIFVVAEVV